MPKTNDELRMDDLKANMKNSMEEVVFLKEARDRQEKMVELVEKECLVRSKMHEEALKDFVKLTPNYEFEKQDGYVTWQKELSTIEQEKKQHELAGNLSQMRKNLRRFDEQIETQTKAVLTIKEKLKELGEDNE